MLIILLVLSSQVPISQRLSKSAVSVLLERVTPENMYACCSRRSLPVNNDRFSFMLFVAGYMLCNGYA